MRCWIVGQTSTTRNQESVLELAAEAGQKHIVELLLQRGADVHLETGFLERTALDIAASEGHEGVVQLLLAHGAEANPAHEGKKPLHFAVAADHVPAVNALSIVNVLLKHGADVDAADEDGHTPLCIAARSGDLDMVSALLDKGATVDGIMDQQALRPLVVAAFNGKECVVELLLRHGAQVNNVQRPSLGAHLDDDQDQDDSNNDDGYNGYYVDEEMAIKGGGPLRAAVIGDELGTATLLLDAGADVNEVDANGRTILHVAARKAGADVIDLLLSRGAKSKPTADCRLLWTPMHEAAKFGNEEALDAMLAHGEEVDSVIWRKDMIMQPGSAVAPERNIIDQPVTPLMVAIEEGSVGAFMMLLQHGAKVDGAVDTPVYTPLCAAARHGNASCIAELLERGASINQPDEAGRTPLYWAILCRQHAAALQLLSAGASPTHAAKDGSTPVSQAEYWSKPSVVKRLKDAVDLLER